MISQVTAEFGFSFVATTLCAVVSASVNDWGAIAWSSQSGFVEARHRPSLEIYDRVGGGDSFASGLIYGLLTTGNLQRAVEYGAAHRALAMTARGDTSMASLAEVAALAAGAGVMVHAKEKAKPTDPMTARPAAASIAALLPGNSLTGCQAQRDRGRPEPAALAVHGQRDRAGVAEPQRDCPPFRPGFRGARVDDALEDRRAARCGEVGPARFAHRRQEDHHVR